MVRGGELRESRPEKTIITDRVVLFNAFPTVTSPLGAAKRVACEHVDLYYLFFR